MKKTAAKLRSKAKKNDAAPPAPEDALVPVIEPVEILPADAANEEGVASDLPVEVSERDEDSGKPPSRSIVPYDPLTVYLREARRHPPLTKEEEHEVAVRYFESKDVEAAYKLVVSNLWLVVKLAREYEKAARNVLDLIQEGNIGLMEAVKNFDPYRGVRFPSYAAWWVRAYIIRYIIANWRMVKIGTTQAQRKLFFNLKREKDKLEREGFTPAPKLLAEKLNVKEDEVIEMEQRLGSSEISVDAPLMDDNDQTLHGLIPNNLLTAEENLAKKEMRALVLKSFDEFSATLNDKERVIFKQRMLGEDKVTLQEMSDQLSISRERVRQIENRLRDKLKIFLADRLGQTRDTEL